MKLGRERPIIIASSVGIALNFLLFFAKIYISLSINSIAIFSDGINNLVDSISCILTVTIMIASAKNSAGGSKYINSKLEQTLSLILSIAVLFVGGYFLYSSLERLVYPTPIWFSQVYFWVIAATVLIKAAMAVFFHVFYKRTKSPALKVMRTDSISDCAVTFVTLLSFILIRYTDFTVDAFAGMAISVFIIIEAVLLIKSSLFDIVNYVKKSTRQELEENLAKHGEIEYITYLRQEENICCFVQLKNYPKEDIINELSKTYGIQIYLLNRGNTETL